MPVVYENWSHRKRCIKYHHHTVFKFQEMRKDIHCRKCGKEMTFTNDYTKSGWKRQCTVDHVLARGLGGSDTVDNFELICGGCNNKKSKFEQKLLNEIRNIGL